MENSIIDSKGIQNANNKNCKSEVLQVNWIEFKCNFLMNNIHSVTRRWQRANIIIIFDMGPVNYVYPAKFVFIGENRFHQIKKQLMPGF